MTLEESMRREYAAAKRYWTSLLAVQLAAMVVAIWMLGRQHSREHLALAIFLLVSPLVTFWLKTKTFSCAKTAEKLRRFFHYREGLGTLVGDTTALPLLLADVSGLPTTDSKPEAAYFSTDLPVGPRRLADLYRESSFYTRKLSAISARIYSTATVIGIVASISFLYSAVYTGALLPTVSQTFSLLFGFFMTGTLASTAFDYSSLSRTAETTFKTCSALRNSGSTRLQDVLLATEDYSSLLTRTPPIPGIVHRTWKKKLANNLSAIDHK